MICLIYIDFSISDCCDSNDTFDKLKEIINNISCSLAAVIESFYGKGLEKKNEKSSEFLIKITSTISKGSIVKQGKMVDLFNYIQKSNENVIMLLKIYSE